MSELLHKSAQQIVQAPTPTPGWQTVMRGWNNGAHDPSSKLCLEEVTIACISATSLEPKVHFDVKGYRNLN